MFVARSIHADHKDLIHDVAYDFYGRRFATCSSDQSVKVWDLGEDGQWHCTSSWKSHSGSVWKVTWAHPEFGQVLATCSFDRSVAIWEELISDGHSGERNQSHWLKKANLVDSRTSVTDVKFAPKHLGLLLATCSSDGMVRIYEAPDIMNLSQWTVQHDINCKMPISCIAWNLSPFHSAMIAVGSDDPTSGGGKIQIYESSENSRRWVKIESMASITEPVHDIAFAPNVGRSYHLIGAATRDVRIISIKPISGQQDPATTLSLSQNNQQNLAIAPPKYDIRQVAQFDDHGAQVWRVSWNITGTILASSGDDGSVRLWKPNYLDSWKSIAVIKGDGQNNSNIPPSAFGATSHGFADTDRVALESAGSQSRSFKSQTQIPSTWR